MIRKFKIWLLKRWRWYRHRSLFVILDPADNSVTLSRALFNHMDVMSLDVAKVYVFSVSAGYASGNVYAFTLNPDIDQPTCLADIQYNSKHHSIGFESLCPTVNRIFYDYGLSPHRKAKLSVDIATVPAASPAGIIIYKILRPHGHAAS